MLRKLLLLLAFVLVTGWLWFFWLEPGETSFEVLSYPHKKVSIPREGRSEELLAWSWRQTSIDHWNTILEWWDPLDCSSLSGELLQSECRDRILLSLSGGVDLCSTLDIDSLRDQCVRAERFSVIVRGWDIQKCSEFSELDDRLMCQSLLQARHLEESLEWDHEVCLAFSGSVRESCLREYRERAYALLLSSPLSEASLSGEICQRLSTDKSEKCEDYVYQNTALRTGNPQYCHLLSHTGEIETCKAWAEESRDAYWYQSAARQGDLTACTSIRSQELRTQCQNELRYAFAQTKRMKLYCEAITDQTWREKCLTSLGKE